MMPACPPRPCAVSVSMAAWTAGLLVGLLLIFVPRDAPGQTTIFDEPFDDEGQFTVTRGATGGGSSSYFKITDGSDIDESYNGTTGKFLAGSDTDDDGDGIPAPQITWTGIDVSGEGGLQFTGRFGGDGSGYEDSDFVRVEYRIDGGAWQDLIAFRGDANDNLAEDTDFNGIGDGATIDDGSVSSFSKDIGGLADSLGLRLTVEMTAQAESFALEDFKIESTTAVQFTADSGAVSEEEGSTSLTIQISEPSSSGDEEVTLEFDDNNSDATQSDFTNGFPATSTSTTVTFSSASDGDTEAVTLDFANDADEGIEEARFNLKNPSSGLELHPSTQFDLTIEDAVSDHDGDVLISELMPDPDAVNDSDGEYVELYNTTGSSISIDGWDIEGNTISGVTIPARGFAVLCRNSDASANGGIDCDNEVSFTLTNSGEEVPLEDDEGTQVDVVDYSDSSFPSVPTGASLVFAGTSQNDDGNNWVVASRRERGFAQDQSGDDGSPGRNGTGQTLQPTTEITGGAGWRMLSAPMSGVNADTLAQVSLVQGVDGHFPNAAANLYQWPGGTDGNVDWDASFSATDDLTGSGAPSGAAGGFIWYLYDAAETEFTDTPPFTLSVPGVPRTGDVTTDQLSGESSGNSAFHLLGNPYAQSFDLSALNLSGRGFQTTVQIWDPSAGSYEGIMQSSTSEDVIGPYQGFFVERATGGSATLTFSASGRRADPIDLKTVEDAPPRIDFRLVGRDEEGSVITRDEALVLHAPDGATPGWDPHDATKLTPLSGRYATAAFRGSLNGETRLQSVMSVPATLPDEGIDLPVSLQLQGTELIGTLRLSWSRWTNVPDGWGLALHDAVTDSTINLRTHSSYAFTLPASKAQSVPGPRSPMEMPDPIRAKAQSDSARFTLTVQPNPLPVELSGFDATVADETARLTWTTASETNNVGFHVEHRGPDADQFASTGFVEGHGTTDAPQQYRYRTDPLDPGRHVFRLRQVDLDGSATRSDTVAVRVRLAEAATMQAAPNPVRTQATVSLRVRTEQEVEVALYDVLGRQVRTVREGPLAPNRAHTLRVKAGDLSSGLYLLRADGEHFQRTRRITVVR
ncbi:MAG: hypothetical protein BRD42_04455 [Bacteroidetes bacterium QS_3_64_15]|nr:MAG: hypothetical protein BRD42_04455 [Bacteroidetes bacterium QS_3_64_15]